jgi:hypothetical protein
VPYDGSYRDELCAFATLVRGRVYVTAEELEDDAELQAIDELYRAVGLRRTRKVWLAYRHGQSEPIGSAIAYRGPLGINFSFIENRCDLLIHPLAPEAEVPALVATLLNASAEAYTDFEVREIPVVADQIAVPALVGLGAEFLRHYCQGVWLQDGQEGFYKHVDQFYSRLMLRAERRRLQHSFTV